MPRTLYVFDLSPPARAAWMAFQAANIPVEVKILDSLQKEHHSSWFVKINPRRCIPTLDDDGFVLWESRAIMRYAVDSYAAEDTIYPKDLKKRAIVDRMLDFDCGSLSKVVSAYVSPILFEHKTSDPKHQRQLHALLDDLNKTTSVEEYMAGSHLTIADISIVTTLTFLEAINFDFSKYTNLNKWIERCKQPAFYAECNKCYEDWKAKTDEWMKIMKAETEEKEKEDEAEEK